MLGGPVLPKVPMMLLILPWLVVSLMTLHLMSALLLPPLIPV